MGDCKIFYEIQLCFKILVKTWRAWPTNLLTGSREVEPNGVSVLKTQIYETLKSFLLSLDFILSIQDEFQP